MTIPTTNSAMRMKALVLHGIGDARVEEIPFTDPGPGEALIRVAFCGVCGSDLPRIFEKGTYSFPRVCGHEFAGVVDRVGEGVVDFAPGDRVAVFPLLWCGNCPACEEGKYVQCLDYDYVGSRRDGAFAEYVLAPAKNLVPVPDDVSLEAAAMTEPAAVALHALRRGGGAGPGEAVVIFGAGPIGILAAQWARILGASRVILFDILPEQIDLAKQMGFDLAYNSLEVEPLRTVEGLTNGRGANLAIEAAGVPQAMIQSLAVTARGGRVVLLGNPSKDVTLPASLLSQVLRREIQILGTWNSDFSVQGNRDDWRDVVEAMHRGLLQVEPLITHRVSIEKSFETLRNMLTRTESFSKVLIHP